ncbi:hypothetical protein Q0M94_06360 [Deinococcus radiomollis]|uniref:hypothetical protein n=1 Tax=Deinococcus radiomollis TaxID=468916 RepID=UPI003892AF1A
MKAVIQAARHHRRKFMEQASTDQSERLAWDLLLAEYLPVLLDVTQLCELNVLRRETVLRGADCVHVDAGSFSFRGLQQDSETNELPCEHGVLKPAVIRPYLQRLTGIQENGLTLTWEQLAAFAESEQHRITASGDLDRLDRALVELFGPEADKHLSGHEPVKPAPTAVNNGTSTATRESRTAPSIQGTLFDGLS